MTEREPERGDGGEEPETAKSRLLFVVARGQGGLRAAIERVLRCLPGLEVIEDRRAGRSFLPRSEPHPREDNRRSPGDPESDGPSGTATVALASTLAIAHAPRTAWASSFPHRA